MNLLLVEDDIAINSILQTIVEELKSDYSDLSYHTCYTGPEAQNYLQSHTVDIVLLDLMLPFLSGEELLPICLKQKASVIVITAKNEVQTLVDVLDKGATDYIAKPFRREEVLARIRKVINQRYPEKQQELHVANLYLNPYTQVARINGEELKLTKIEFAILAVFMSEPERVFTKKQIYEKVWGSTYLQDQTLTVHLSHLRSKLKQAGFADCLKVIWGVGWRLL